MNRTHDIGGRFLGIPYDWRRPTLRKIVRRVWIPGGPAFVPKVFGWGWTLNFANPKTWALIGVVSLLGLVAAVAG